MEKIYVSVARMHRAHAILLVEGCALLVLLALYAYCVVASAVHVALRQDALYTLKDERASLNTLEEHYLTNMRKLSEGQAYEMGLVPAREVAYLSLKEPTGLSRAE